MLEFQEDFFKQEVRNGFYIDETVKTLWAAELEVLQKVAEICDRHGIIWYAAYGTLLGAIRHEGFVPWEDDMDICVKRRDYNRLLQILPKELPQGYFMWSPQTEAGYGKFHTIIIGDKDVLTSFPQVAPKTPFSEDIVDFLNDLSKELMQSREAKAFPDVVTLGFWLRRASLLSLKQRFITAGSSLRVGRGVAFHIAPSNVPVNYAYSLFTGLLCGNANVVRIPSKDFPQIEVINRAVSRVLEKHPDMKPYIALVRYDRSQVINDILSALCDVRVIWGGDATITELRKSPLPPRATEITFADRYSLAVIDSDEYMQLVRESVDNKSENRIASDFYNDTYLSDQNACTSPRVVVWTGGAKREAKEFFWRHLSALAKEKYHFQPVQGIDKLTMEYMASASGLGMMKQISKGDNRLVRVHVSELSPKLMDYRGNSGYFYEYDCDDILMLRDFCNNTHCQTIGLLGAKTLVEPLLQSGICGVDRIVPIGHTMDYDLIWDGYNLVERFTRTISIL